VFTIKVEADHQSLQHFSTQKELNRRESRWMSFFCQYDGLDFTYRPGVENVVPDATSRIVEDDEDVAPTLPFFPDPAAKEDPCQPVSAVLSPHAKDFQPWQPRFNTARTPLVVSDLEREDRFLRWPHFRQVVAKTGALDIDAFCNEDGINSHCNRFFHPGLDALQQSWSGQAVWAHPPYSPRILVSTVLHSEQCWQLSPQTTTVVMMVPQWPNQSWWRSLQQPPWKHVITFPAGEKLFNDHRGVPLPPTHWPVQVFLLESCIMSGRLQALPMSHLGNLPVVSSPVATELHHLAQAAQADPLYCEQLQAVLTAPTSHPDYTIQDHLLYFRGVVQVPAGEKGLAIRQQLLWECHDCILAGHKGRDKTDEAVRRRATWEGLGSDVAEYVKSCHTCQTSKKASHRPLGVLHPLPVPTSPFQSCSLDWLTDLPTAKGGKDAILVVVDRFTKLVILIPACSTDSVLKTAQRYLKHVVRHHGVQDSLVSDRDVKFLSSFWQQLMEMLGTRLDMTTTAHQQANGQAEIQMKLISAALRALPLKTREHWLEVVPLLEFALNNSVHSGTGYSPFFLTKGVHPATPVDLLLKPRPDHPKDLRAFTAHLRVNHQLAASAILDAQAAMKHQYDRLHTAPPGLRQGEMVYLVTEGLTAPAKAERHLPKKLQAVRTGPYKISAVLPRDNYELEIKDTKMHPVVHVSRLKKAETSNKFPRAAQFSPPRWDPRTKSAEHEVDTILRSRCLQPTSRRPAAFLVKWKDLPPEQASWRTFPQLRNCMPLLTEYLQRHNQQEVLDRLLRQHPPTA